MSNNDEWGAYSGEDDNAVEIKDFGDFDSVDSAINLDMEEPIHKAQNQSVSTRNTDEDEKEIKDTNKYIKIEIDSIDKLIGLLKFHSTNFEAAMDRVASNKDLSSILSELQKIKTVDISKFSSKLEQAVENSNAKLTETINKIDLSQIEKKIDNEKIRMKELTLFFNLILKGIIEPNEEFIKTLYCLLETEFGYAWGDKPKIEKLSYTLQIYEDDCHKDFVRDKIADFFEDETSEDIWLPSTILFTHNPHKDFGVSFYKTLAPLEVLLSALLAPKSTQLQLD
jgi:hypothetical protein